MHPVAEDTRGQPSVSVDDDGSREIPPSSRLEWLLFWG